MRFNLCVELVHNLCVINFTIPRKKLRVKDFVITVRTRRVASGFKIVIRGREAHVQIFKIFVLNEVIHTLRIFIIVYFVLTYYFIDLWQVYEKLSFIY